MEYTIEETILLFNEKKDILPFMNFVVNKIITPYLSNSGRDHSAKKRFPEAGNKEELKESMFSDLFLALKKSGFFLKFSKGKQNSKGYIYSVLSRINSIDSIKKIKDKYSSIKKRIKDTLENNRDEFYFWLGNIKKRSLEWYAPSDTKKFYHNSFGDIPPDLVQEDVKQIPKLPALSNINLTYIFKDELKPIFEKFLLQMEASFKLKQLADYFWENTFEKKEQSLEGMLENPTGAKVLLNIENTVHDVIYSEKDIKFFERLNAQIPSRMSGHLYWYAKAVQEITGRDPEDKRVTDVYRTAEELSEGRTKRTTCDYQIKGSKNSFKNIYTMLFKDFYGEASEELKEKLLSEYLKMYIKQVENLENPAE